MYKILSAGLGIVFFSTSKSAVQHIENQTQPQPLNAQPFGSRHAICILYPSNLQSKTPVKGLVSFSQPSSNSPCKIVASVRGLRPNGLHGFHIHEWGDLTEGCASAGPHYNPYNNKHGDFLEKDRHVGDLGNLKADEKGNAYFAMEDNQIQLFGEESVIGRSCVVHENEDDLGRGRHPDSATTGHSGQRIACGVIGLASEFKNLPPK